MIFTAPLRRRFVLPLLLLSTTLGACAATPAGDFPSLARRPIERQLAVPPSPVVPPLPEPVEASLADALIALGRDADNGETAFRTALSTTGDAVTAARGAPVGSEVWATAQLALSRLETSRAPTVLALTELDRLAIVQADAGNAAAVQAIAVQQSRVAAIAERQAALLNRLMAALAE
ncbi:MAG: hypothetical protein MUF41_03150 [Sphingopyxis sp.]|jgi:hypothetical protein|nr:hypothetical protein [Sphingopyxis sp.]